MTVSGATLALVAVGGALGSMARFMVAAALPVQPPRFPMATFVINLVGSGLLGLFLALRAREAMSAPTLFLLGTGFCGGFTTFSTFSAEALVLLQSGSTATAGLYVAGSCIGGLLCAMIGYRLGM